MPHLGAGEAEPTRVSLVEFKNIVTQPFSKGRLPVIVGGQAVNFWATHYAATEPELTQFAPFTSKDLDLLGDTSDVSHLARLLNVTAIRPRLSAASPVVGIIEFTPQPGQRTAIEILNSTSHLSKADAEAQAIEVHSHSLDAIIRVLNPVACLIDKAHSVHRFSQAERQDLRHVRILIPCTRAYLREHLIAVSRNELPSRLCVQVLERVFVFSSSPIATAVTQKHQVNWLGVWPMEELRQSNASALKNFAEKRLQIT